MRVRAASFAVLAFLVFPAHRAPSAQGTQQVSIDPDKVLGWMKIYDSKGATQPARLDHRVYSPAQLSIAQQFAVWMQASYLPTGALGDVVQIRNEKLGPYNQNTAALPQSYGAYAKLYTELKYDANRKLTPMTNSHIVWTMEANGFFGIPANGISTPERAYFTLPTFVQQGYGPELEKAADLSSHPVLGQFPSFFRRNSVTGNRKYVLLSKDRRLPFVKVTRGEYLDAVEIAIARARAEELRKITQAEQGVQKRIDVAMKYVDEKTAKRVAVLAQNREKYRNRLQEPAEIATDEPDVMLENYPDVFERNGGTPMRLPVYTIDPRVVELSKTDAPQWIVMSWTAQLNDPVSRSLHEAIRTNVDFDYIYNYFFDPAKVKGQPYKPLRSPAAETAPVAAAASAASRANASAHFFDDFSTTVVGKKPLNWRSTLDNTGASSVVTELKGLDGHWALMSNFELTPQQLKPLPRDFEFSFDVVAAQNYTWGARGMYVKLWRRAAGGAGESSVTLRIRPGFGGRDGEIVVDAQVPGAPGYLNSSRYAVAPGFSNDAAINRVTVTLKKTGELLQAFVGQKKVGEYEKAIPADLQFDALSFSLSGVSAADRMFISNVRIGGAD